MDDIRAMRIASGASQARIAAKSGVDRTRLCFAEKGYIVLPPEQEKAVRSAILEEARAQVAAATALLAVGA